MAGSVQTHNSISFISIVFSTLYVYFWAGTQFFVIYLMKPSFFSGCHPEKNQFEFYPTFFHGGKSSHLFKSKNRVQIKGATMFLSLQLLMRCLPIRNGHLTRYTNHGFLTFSIGNLNIHIKDKFQFLYSRVWNRRSPWNKRSPTILKNFTSEF